jgi:hypothetical protein
MRKSDSIAARICALIEGAYDLEEWHMAEGVMRPPQVIGRFMLKDGAVSTLMHDRTRPSLQTTLAMYGSYTLNEREFAYSYDEPLRIVQSDSGTTLSRTPMWDGKRLFAVKYDDGVVHLRAAGRQEFLFSVRGLLYSEAGTVLRVWRRITNSFAT